MSPADSSDMNSEAVFQQIMEQTSNLEVGEPQPEEETQEFVAQEQQLEGEEEEQPTDTSEEETKEVLEPEPVDDAQERRIKYKGKEIEIPREKVKEYLQKGYKVEETLRELKEKERELAAKEQQGPIDFTKIDEEFVAELQKSPTKTLMQFAKMVYESSEKEKLQQRKFDRQFETEVAKTIPHWDAIRDGYHDYKDDGFDHKAAIAMAERDFFANLYLESKQKGVEEGEKKATLKMKAQIPSGNKKASVGDTSSGKNMKDMSSEDLAKALGLKFTKHPDW